MAYKFPKLYMRSDDDRYALKSMIAATGLTDIVMAEVGSYNGESTEVFADSDKVRIVYAVDPWVNGYDPNDPASMEVDMANVEGYFDKMMAAHPEKVAKMKMNSMDGARAFAPKSIDLVYLDGDHRYEAVREDIRAWLPKIKNGGYISGHDYGRPEYRISEAVRDELNTGLDFCSLGNWMISVDKIRRVK